MLTTLVLLALSLAPNVVISTPLNIEPIDVTRRQIANDDGGKPGNPGEGGTPGKRDTKQPADRLTPPDPPPELSEFEWNCRDRGTDDVELVWSELLVAKDILKKGYTIFSLSPFYQAMFAQSLRDNPSFELQVQTKYAYAFSIFSNPANKVKITCDQNLCDTNTVALVIAPLNIMNLCNPWFDDSVKAKSDVAATECKAGSDKADNWKNLAKFKATKCMIAHLTDTDSDRAANTNEIAFTLVHEIMHTKYPTQSLDTPPRYVPSPSGAKTARANFMI